MSDFEGKRSLVVIDTTEFWKSLELTGAGWPEILAWSKAGFIDVAITEVSILETVRHYSTGDANKVAGAKRLRQTANEFKNLGFLPSGMLPDEGLLRELVELQIASYSKRLREQLKESCVVVLPFPSIGHDELVRRDLDLRKPFDPSGKGYRDALSWESLLEHLNKLTVPRNVVFVSNNTADFADMSNNNLETSLEAELVDTGHQVCYFRTLKDAVDDLREYISRESGRGENVRVVELVQVAILDAIQRLFGKSVLTKRDADPRQEAEIRMDWLLPIEFTDVTIEGLYPDESSIDIDIFDIQEGKYFVHAVVSVEVELDGFVRKADYREGLGLAIFHPDWDDQYMNVGMSEEVTMSWYVTVVDNRVEDISFDLVEPTDFWSDEDLPGFQGWTRQGTPIQEI